MRPSSRLLLAFLLVLPTHAATRDDPGSVTRDDPGSLTTAQSPALAEGSEPSTAQHTSQTREPEPPGVENNTTPTPTGAGCPRRCSCDAALLTVACRGSAWSQLPPSVTRLDLSHNGLTALPASLLASLPALHSLDLSHNNLTTLPAGLLASLPALRELDLSHNDLTDLNDRTVPPPGGLDLPNDDINGTVAGGLLSNDSTASSDLWGVLSLPNLHTLNISHNSGLCSLPDDALAGLLALTTLDASHLSCLTHIPGRALAAAPSLRRVDLRHSGLTTLHHHAVTHSNTTLDLRGVTTLACTCDLAWLPAWLAAASPPGPRLLISPNTPCPDQPGAMLDGDVDAWNLTCTAAHAQSCPQAVRSRVGEPTVLTCVVGGQPTPSVQWVTNRGVHLPPHHPGGASPHQPGFHYRHYWHLAPLTYHHNIPVTDRMVILSNGSLYIDYVTRSDGGNFTCHARNAFGNATVTVTLALDYSVFKVTADWSMMVGLVTAVCVLVVMAICAVLRHVVHFCSAAERQKRKSIKELLQIISGSVTHKALPVCEARRDGGGDSRREISEYKTEKFDTLKAYKAAKLDAKLDKISAFKTHKIDQLRTYKQATVANVLTSLAGMGENYQAQVGRVRDNYNTQVEKLRENYAAQICRLHDYRVEKIDTVRDNYHSQALKVREYGAAQMARLREQYKVQQQHLLKLLELLDIGNCMSVIEAECLRTDSALFDGDQLGGVPAVWDPADWEVPPPPQGSSPSDTSEYLTAGSQVDVRVECETSSSSGASLGGVVARTTTVQPILHASHTGDPAAVSQQHPAPGRRRRSRVHRRTHSAAAGDTSDEEEGGTASSTGRRPRGGRGGETAGGETGSPRVEEDTTQQQRSHIGPEAAFPLLAPLHTASVGTANSGSNHHGDGVGESSV